MLEYEESVGKVWNNFLRKKTSKSYESERVFFADKARALKVFYHLLGGDKGKELHVTDKRFIDTSRSFLEKISGFGSSFFLAWQDEKGLYLPASLAYFPKKEDNETLYFWLIAMSTQTDTFRGSLTYKNFWATEHLCDTYPGFKSFYTYASEQLIEENEALSFVKSLIPENLTSAQQADEIDSYPFPMWIYPSLGSTKKYSDFDDEDEPVRG